MIHHFHYKNFHYTNFYYSILPHFHLVYIRHYNNNNFDNHNNLRIYN